MSNLIKKTYNLFLECAKTPTNDISLFRINKFAREQLGEGSEMSKDFSEFFKTEPIYPSHIERFCLARLSDVILSRYPVNIGEAYLLSHLMLAGIDTVNNAYLKLGTSGLLTPTVIESRKVEDIEVIAHFIIESLKKAEMIAIEGDNIRLGKEFKLEF